MTQGIVMNLNNRMTTRHIISMIRFVNYSLVAIAIALGITKAVFSFVINVICEYGILIFFSTPNKFE